jgi:carbonic anhydrase
MKLVRYLLIALVGCGAAPSPAPEPPKPAEKWSYAEGHWPGTCATGQHQSPIDLPAAGTTSAHAPESPHWSPGPLQITNDGHAVKLEGTVGSMTFDGTTYKLAQFHFHSPSEHTLNGKSYDLEAHFVHKSEQGKLLVIGILFEKKGADPALTPMWSALPTAGTTPQSIANVDFTQLLPKSPRYFTYDGSLTTPPCTEGVTWLVVEPAPADEVSTEQLEILHSAIHGATNRPTQPLHDRKITELVP